jgi:hypothetical protein
MLVAILIEKILDARAVGKLGLVFGHADDFLEATKKQNAHTHAAILAPAAIARANFLTALAALDRSHHRSGFQEGTALAVPKRNDKSGALAPEARRAYDHAIGDARFSLEEKVWQRCEFSSPAQAA